MCCGMHAGYALANKGRDTRALQAYLGHKNIQHTVRYTELSRTQFFWLINRSGSHATSSIVLFGVRLVNVRYLTL